ncbi:zinc metalloprotease [Sinosporangium siamense]|uniref:Zinc metalloprotease n=1 Tax=Sinosporangium siamense TaxID=1367973 RepID=A0A919V5V8_9ACTN|nr:zinc metalloprotease [Sinosporangium siamense]GII91306.1 zinc metalloprotease [Sinosporangium siamense]
MTRRAIAVASACLLAFGPPGVRPERAHAHAGVCPSPDQQLEVRHKPGAHRRPGPRGREPHAPSARQVARMLADLERRLSALRTPVPAVITVPVWVHVLSDGAKRASDLAVRRQIETLNEAYSGKFGGVDTGVRFRLVGVTVTVNAEWFRDPLVHEVQMKRGLRKGGVSMLNLYLAQLSELVLGYSTYPYWFAGNPRADGVVIDWRSLPDGALRDFNRGYTGVHEIGHWLGLLHTFENGCEAPGDAVDDTPAQARATQGCPESADSCPGGGPDPIHNYMDYSVDACMREFTAGQGQRMRQMWAAYRTEKRDITLNG